jgi:hypothetical protein
MICFCCIGGITPKRIVIANAVGIVSNIVPSSLVTPRLGGSADFDADAPSQIIQTFLCDFRKISLSD